MAVRANWALDQSTVVQLVSKSICVIIVDVYKCIKQKLLLAIGLLLQQNDYGYLFFSYFERCGETIQKSWY